MIEKSRLYLGLSDRKIKCIGLKIFNRNDHKKNNHDLRGQGHVGGMPRM